jgi:hypothetical protein
MNMNPKVDLYQPIEAARVGPPPLVIRAVVTTTNAMIAGGMPTGSRKAEDYILLSALPKELQERVRTAVQAIIAGM